MSRPRFLGSLLGQKILVAVTGVVLFGFVVGHMTGNLKALLGNAADGVPKIDVYGHWLRIMGAPLFSEGQLLWITRIVLLAALVVHIALVIKLARHSQAARPTAYVQHKLQAATPSARWMMWSGLAILAFVVFHIMHLTLGTIAPSEFVEAQVYGNLFRAFQGGGIVLLYVAAMVCLAMHLYHGVWSLFQTLGLDNPDRNKLLRLFAVGMTVILLVGFASVPLTFFMGDMAQPPDPSTLPAPYGGR